jgi:hypothetical protein
MLSKFSRGLINQGNPTVSVDVVSSKPSLASKPSIAPNDDIKNLQDSVKLLIYLIMKSHRHKPSLGAFICHYFSRVELSIMRTS